jgi:hypothetical protein
MTFVEAVIASVAGIVGAYEAFLSMFVQRRTVLVWLSAPLVWPVSWLLNGPMGKFGFAYLLLCVLVIATNAALYAFLSWAVLGLLRRWARPSKT